MTILEDEAILLTVKYLGVLQHKSATEAPGHLLGVDELLDYLDEFEEASETVSYAKLRAVAELLKSQRNSLFELFNVERKDRSRALNEVDKLTKQLKEEIRKRNAEVAETAIWQKIAGGLQDGLNDLKLIKTRGKNGFHGRKNSVRKSG